MTLDGEFESFQTLIFKADAETQLEKTKDT